MGKGRYWRLGLLVILGLGVAGFAWWLVRGSGTQPGELAALNAQEVARGKPLYQSSCAQCHGLQGEGAAGWRQQNADRTYPPPPHDSSGHTWHHSDKVLFRIIKEGGAIYEDSGFKSAMPAFGESLNDREIRAVITYLKSLWRPQERAYQADVSSNDPPP